MLQSSNYTYNLTDMQLISADGSLSTSFGVLYYDTVNIYVRNEYTTTNQTFLITVESQGTNNGGNGGGGSTFSIISLVLFILVGLFVLICLGAIIRVCVRRRNNAKVGQNNQLNQQMRA